MAQALRDVSRAWPTSANDQPTNPGSKSGASPLPVGQIFLRRVFATLSRTMARRKAWALTEFGAGVILFVPDPKPQSEADPMKKLIGFLTVAVLIIAGMQVLRKHQSQPLLSPAEKQTLRDAAGDDSDVAAPAKGHVEWRYSPGGLAGVYNPATKRAEWKYAYSHSWVAGVYNPRIKSVEWKGPAPGCVAGVYNPASQTVEWKGPAPGVVAGVYNPRTKTVEWQGPSPGWVAGVYNPRTRSVEWRNSPGCVAGVYNPASQSVEWRYSPGWVVGVFIPD